MQSIILWQLFVAQLLRYIFQVFANFKQSLKNHEDIKSSFIQSWKMMQTSSLTFTYLGVVHKLYIKEIKNCTLCFTFKAIKNSIDYHCTHYTCCKNWNWQGTVAVLDVANISKVSYLLQVFENVVFFVIGNANITNLTDSLDSLISGIKEYSYLLICWCSFW